MRNPRFHQMWVNNGYVQEYQVPVNTCLTPRILSVYLWKGQRCFHGSPEHLRSHEAQAQLIPHIPLIRGGDDRRKNQGIKCMGEQPMRGGQGPWDRAGWGLPLPSSRFSRMLRVRLDDRPIHLLSPHSEVQTPRTHSQL